MVKQSCLVRIFYKKIFPLIIIGLLSFGIFAGCGLYNANSIKVDDAFRYTAGAESDSIEIPLKIRKAVYVPAHILFNRSESLSELADIISGMTNENEKYTTEINGKFLFIKKEAEIVSYYMIKELVVLTQTQKYGITGIDYPYHYMPDMSALVQEYNGSTYDNHDMMYYFLNGNDYEINCSFEEWIKFYKDLDRKVFIIREDEKSIDYGSQTMTFKTVGDKNYIGFEKYAQ